MLVTFTVRVIKQHPVNINGYFKHHFGLDNDEDGVLTVLV